MTEVTFVTCFYKIKSKFDAEIYKKWASNFLNTKLNCNLVIFTDKNSIMYIEELVLGKPNIKIILKSIDDLYLYKYKEKWIENQSKNNYLNYVSWELIMLWCEKIYFVNDVISNKYFDTEWYGWCDIGYFRNGLLNEWPNPQKIKILNKNKIYYAQLIEDYKMNYLINNTNQRNIYRLPKNPIDPHHNSLAGGFFIINKKSIIDYSGLFESKIKLYFEHNYLIKDDQVIILDCIASNGDMFEMINSNYDWFYFLSYLN